MPSADQQSLRRRADELLAQFEKDAAKRATSLKAAATAELRGAAAGDSASLVKSEKVIKDLKACVKEVADVERAAANEQATEMAKRIRTSTDRALAQLDSLAKASATTSRAVPTASAGSDIEASDAEDAAPARAPAAAKKARRSA